MKDEPERHADIMVFAANAYRVLDPKPTTEAEIVAFASIVATWERRRCMRIAEIYIETDAKSGPNSQIVAMAMREVAKAMKAYIKAGSTFDEAPQRKPK